MQKKPGYYVLQMVGWIFLVLAIGMVLWGWWMAAQPSTAYQINGDFLLRIFTVSGGLAGTALVLLCTGYFLQWRRLHR